MYTPPAECHRSTRHNKIPERIPPACLRGPKFTGPRHDLELLGGQEGRFFHGYYEYRYLPLYIFCGEHVLCARLRQANIDASAGALKEVERVVQQIRARSPEVRIILRGDSGFCRDELMDWCERQQKGRLGGVYLCQAPEPGSEFPKGRPIPGIGSKPPKTASFFRLQPPAGSTTRFPAPNRASTATCEICGLAWFWGIVASSVPEYNDVENAAVHRRYTNRESMDRPRRLLARNRR